MNTINLSEKLSRFSTHRDFHIAGDNRNDEMELDIDGKAARRVRPGEMFIVPKGVFRRPRADTECKVLVIEPKGESNTGDADAVPAQKPRI